jgi:hypothetical protein
MRQQVLVAMTDGGLDFTFEAIGNVDTMARGPRVVSEWV